MNVTPQIDVTGTAVSSLNFFRGGLRVLTTGNVHPTAIEAALQLGRHLYVSLHHTGDAVDALGGGGLELSIASLPIRERRQQRAGVSGLKRISVWNSISAIPPLSNPISKMNLLYLGYCISCWCKVECSIRSGYHKLSLVSSLRNALIPSPPPFQPSCPKSIPSLTHFHRGNYPRTSLQESLPRSKAP
jgi:hypothetical protein